VLTSGYTLRLDSQQISHKLVLHRVTLVSKSSYITYSYGGDSPHSVCCFYTASSDFGTVFELTYNCIIFEGKTFAVFAICCLSTNTFLQIVCAVILFCTLHEVTECNNGSTLQYSRCLVWWYHQYSYNSVMW